VLHVFLLTLYPDDARMGRSFHGEMATELAFKVLTPASLDGYGYFLGELGHVSSNRKPFVSVGHCCDVGGECWSL
jgi:hypothetical protein